MLVCVLVLADCVSFSFTRVCFFIHSLVNGFDFITAISVIISDASVISICSSWSSILLPLLALILQETSARLLPFGTAGHYLA